MKQTTKKILPVSLAALMMFSVTTPCLAAEDSTEKEEIIYANLSFDGQVESMYAVNAFDLSQPGTIYDYGIYSETKNLSTSDALHYENGRISISAPQGRFYYQGTLEGRQLPWNIQVSYFLDGSPIDASQLAGQSGHLQIQLDITKNAAQDASFYENYVLQASLSLDTSLCKNIVAEGATQANVGTNKQLTYTILPGQEQHITIQSDVSDFEMDGISINGVSLALNLDADSLNSSSFTEKLGELQNAVSTLNEGAQDLTNGSNQLESGLNRIAGTSSTLTQASDTILDSLGKLNDGANTLKTQLTNVPTGLDQAIGGLQQVTTQSDAEKALLASLQNNEDPNVQALLSLYQQKMGAVNQVSSGLAEKKSELTALDPAIQAMTDSLSSLKSNYGVFDSALNSYVDGVATVQKNMGQLTNGATKLSEGTQTMDQQTSHLDQTIDEELQKAIDSFAGKDFTPISYVSSENEHVDSVQFVLKTADIHKPKTEVPAEPETPHLSFWQKLVNLF